MTTTLTRPAVRADAETTDTSAGRSATVALGDHGVFFGAATAVILHTADDNFLQPNHGVSPADHLLSGLAPLVALVVAAWAYPRVRDGARALIAFATALTGLVVGLVESGSHLVLSLIHI